VFNSRTSLNDASNFNLPGDIIETLNALQQEEQNQSNDAEILGAEAWNLTGHNSKFRTSYQLS
jgi:hypothetical protein